MMEIFVLPGMHVRRLRRSEPVGVLLRKGNTGSNTAAARVTVLRQRLSRPGGASPGVDRRAAGTAVAWTLRRPAFRPVTDVRIAMVAPPWYEVPPSSYGG